MLGQREKTASPPLPMSMEEVFDAPHASHLPLEVLERTVQELLEAYPEAPVAALTETGILVEMPPSIELRANPVIAGRSGIDGASNSDRSVMLANWDRVLRLGAGRCSIAPAAYGETHLHCIDLRERHGIVFSLLARGAGGSTASAPEPAPAPERTLPRFATATKDQYAYITSIDAATAAILGWLPTEMAGCRSLEFIHPDDQPLAVDNWMQMLAHPGPARRVRQRLRHSDGSWVWFEVTNHNLLEDPAHECVVCEMVDISEEMAAHEEVRAHGQLLDRLAETVPVGLLQIDEGRRIVYTNDRLHEILGTAPAETVEAQLAALLPADQARVGDAVRIVLAEGAVADLEVAVQPPDGEELRFCTIGLRALTHEDGSVSGAIGCLADVTEATHLREELRQRASTDELTGCSNRAAIVRALEAHIAGGTHRSERAILFVDLDEFKQLNDRCGHAAGDRLLRTVAAQLRGAVRAEDLVGRIGGDEFLVLCPDVGGAHKAVRLAERIEAALRDRVAASVGVAWSCGDDISAEELLDRADRAMYASKRRRVARGGPLHPPGLAA
jgi:diguanylate cyclase (GGDEF)-like protein/PAS domain S-box-containing protein